jgi:hypothetical protein
VNNFSSKDIKITYVNILLPLIINKLEAKEIKLDLSLLRDEELWDNIRMSRWIESILLKLPLPVFYFDVSNTKEWTIVDGMQRLNTIQRFFIDKDLILSDLEFLKDLNGQNYNDLENKLLRIISDTSFLTYQIEAQTHEEVRKILSNRLRGIV